MDTLTQPLWNVYGDKLVGHDRKPAATGVLVGRIRADSRAEAVDALRQRAADQGFDLSTLFAGWQCDCGAH